MKLCVLALGLGLFAVLQLVLLAVSSYWRLHLQAPPTAAPTFSSATYLGDQNPQAQAQTQTDVDATTFDPTGQPTAMPVRRQATAAVKSTPLTLSHWGDAQWRSRLRVNVCPVKTVQSLSRPRLSDADHEWCSWATRADGGQVVPGKSWGTLKGDDRAKFDTLDCNFVYISGGKNPSCDESWGDKMLANWKRNEIKGACKVDAGRCFKHEVQGSYCWMTQDDAVLDFSRVELKPLDGRRDMGAKTRVLADGFIRASCDGSKLSGGLAPITFDPKSSNTSSTSSKKCDVTVNETLILVSHDEIGIAETNFGHFINDVMNVWVSLWLSGTARNARASVSMLNMDSLRTLAFLDDKNHSFFLTYEKNLQRIYRATEFSRSTVCAKGGFFVPAKTPLLFVWEGYSAFDSPCSFVGPSSLFQRWNFHVRDSYGLLLPEDEPQQQQQQQQSLTIMLLVRNVKTNLWGSNRSSRNYLNKEAIVDAIEGIIRHRNRSRDRGLGLMNRSRRGLPKISLIVQDLATLSFAAQVELMQRVSLLVGMHGAGIPQSLHMPIGNEFCCGVLELFPKGEHTDIRYHGNMVRKMGMQYSRIDIDAEGSRDDGSVVPIDQLTAQLDDMLDKLLQTPTCVLPSVLSDPFMETALGTRLERERERFYH